jgi:hypothetical protein
LKSDPRIMKEKILVPPLLAETAASLKTSEDDDITSRGSLDAVKAESKEKDVGFDSSK